MLDSITATAGDQDITVITIANDVCRVVLTDLGARILELHVPDRDGELADVVLGRASYDELPQDPYYFGVTAGRCANRIREGRFEIDGTPFTVTPNEGPNHLHGGPRGFDTYVWSTELDAEHDRVTFTRRSPDGEEGYPGTLDTRVIYTLEGAALDIRIEAETDRPTLVNVVNHAYFNLAGHDSGTVLDQVLQINAEAYTPVDAELLPTGEILPVEGTPYDFRSPTPIGTNIDAVGANGFDHNWVLDGDGMRQVATLTDPASGRRLTLVTDQPGTQVYTGGHLEGASAKGDQGAYAAFAGVTAEMQTYPDSINHPTFPQRVLRPGETYVNVVRYEFSVV
ncbi:aldose epimerase family protein [Aeromicrobium sp. NPDC092404]|uniref:aldose epimerase family protein n=1 Tax=Aeromicrobium sp. NPDC092404 TaxID=3154976 RepID=UPI00343803E0